MLIAAVGLGCGDRAPPPKWPEPAPPSWADPIQPEPDAGETTLAGAPAVAAEPDAKPIDEPVPDADADAVSDSESAVVADPASAATSPD